MFEEYYAKIDVPKLPEGYFDHVHPYIREWRRARGVETLTDEQIRRARAGYYGMVTFQDKMVGRVVEFLDPRPVTIRTLDLGAVICLAGQRRSGHSRLQIHSLCLDMHNEVEVPDGDILVNGDATDRLMLVDFPRPYMLSKAGQNLYSATDEVRQTISTPGGPLLRVGALERSNVNIVSELMLMIDAARSYETHQRVIAAIDEALEATVNEIARS